MRTFLNTYATQATAGLFLVAGLTGVAIFFHLGDRYLKGAHEWLSMAFLLVAALHLARHWRAMVAMLRQRRLQAIAAVSGLALGGFVIAASLQGAGGNPMVALANRLAEAPLETLAPALNVSVDELVVRLEVGGIKGVQTGQSLKSIAAERGLPVPKVMSILVKL